MKYSIETDSKPRAVELANIFIRNGWLEVSVVVHGQAFSAPFGALP